MVDSVYWADSTAADGTAEAKWAFDDIAGEVTRAGYGMGSAAYTLPFLPEDRSPSTNYLTLRSNPERRVGLLKEELSTSHVAVAVSDAHHFGAGDVVLLTDRNGSESAEILAAGPQRLTFRSLETMDGRLRRGYSPQRRARVLGLREVRLGFDPTDAGNVLWKEVSGSPRRILSRSLRKVQFDHLDAHGRTIPLSQLECGPPVSAIRIHLRLDDAARAASIPSLTTAVALGRHSATIDLPLVTPPRLEEGQLVIEFGPVVESPMGPR